MDIFHPTEAHNVVVAAATAATAAATASAFAVEGENARAQRPDNEYASDMDFGINSSRSALSGSGKGGQGFANLESALQNSVWRK